MKKSEPPHSIVVEVCQRTKNITNAKCSCVAGAGGFCHHVIGLLFYLAHCKQLGLKAIPDDLTCTSLPQRWSVPRERKIPNKAIQDVWVKKPQFGANYDKYVKSTLYSPSTMYSLMTSESNISTLDPKPLMATIIPTSQHLTSCKSVATRFGNAAIGSVLSYQQKLSGEYVINNFLCTDFPSLPLENSGERLENNVMYCLDETKQAMFDSLQLTREVAVTLEQETLTQSNSNLWFLLREKRITASKYGRVALRVSNFENLVGQLNPTRRVITADMRRGMELESVAAMTYANKAKKGTVNLFPSGLIINPKCPWLGCTPDRKVFDMEAEKEGMTPFRLLEVKVVKEGSTNFHGVRYLCKDPITNQLKLKKKHEYFYQVQCHIALSGLDWCDFFSYIDEDTFHCERITLDREFFQGSKDKVDTFFFSYYLK